MKYATREDLDAYFGREIVGIALEDSTPNADGTHSVKVAIAVPPAPPRIKITHDLAAELRKHNDECSIDYYRAGPPEVLSRDTCTRFARRIGIDPERVEDLRVSFSGWGERQLQISVVGVLSFEEVNRAEAYFPGLVVVVQAKPDNPAARMDAALVERKSAAYRARRGWSR